MSQDKRHSRLTAASEVLQGLLQNSKSQLADGFSRWRLEQEWEKVVGSVIAAQSSPAAYERGVLYVWVSHPTWMQQFWFCKDMIKENVNGFMGRDWARDVKFTLNRRAAQPVESES